MKTYQVASYSKKTITPVTASSMAKAASLFLGVASAVKQMGGHRDWANAKGKAGTEFVTVFTADEIVPDYFTKR
jgi:hypothetical protein